MDLRAYYRKLRGIEAELREASVVMISRETSDGGRAGVRNDVPRSLAARLMVDEKADLATPEESAQFRAEVETKWKAGHGSEPWVVGKPLPDGRGSMAGHGPAPHIGRGPVAGTVRTTPNAPGEKS